MGKPKAPEPPDPTKTIETQQKVNMQDQDTPQGSLRYVADPSSPSGFRSISTLSPQEQALYEKGGQLDLQALGLAGKTLDSAGNVIGQPPDFSGVPAPITSVDLEKQGRIGPGEMAEKVGDAAINERVGMATPGSLAAGAGTKERFDMGMLPKFNDITGAGQGVQGDLSYRSLGALPTASDATRQRVESAMYDRQKMYLDPQFKQEADAMSAQLANKGIPLGSRAHQQAMEEFARAKEQAYSGARNDAITMGGAEQSRLIADQLGIRGQGAREIENVGQFRNLAQAQRFGQGVTQTQSNNAAAQAAMDARLAALGQRNTAGQADFENQFRTTEQANKVGQQTFENQLAATGFNNLAGQTDYGNRLAGAQSRNQAVGQNNQQVMSTALQNNQAAQQDFQNLFANANLTNEQRKQAIQEIIQKHNLPLGDYAALMSGTAPMLPNFNATQVMPVDAAGIINQGYGQQLGAHNANVAQSQFLPKMIGQVGSAALMSDRRRKRNIVPRGTMSSGLPWYTYTIDGVSEAGVMADEVRQLFPEAVVRYPDGYDRVHYDMLH